MYKEFKIKIKDKANLIDTSMLNGWLKALLEEKKKESLVLNYMLNVKRGLLGRITAEAYVMVPFRSWMCEAVIGIWFDRLLASKQDAIHFTFKEEYVMRYGTDYFYTKFTKTDIKMFEELVQTE